MFKRVCNRATSIIAANTSCFDTSFNSRCFKYSSDNSCLMSRLSLSYHCFLLVVFFKSLFCRIFVLFYVGKRGQLAADDDDTENAGTCQKWADFVCGIPRKAEEHSLEEAAAQKRVFLKESRFWSKILNINAGIGLVVVSFLIGFFR